MIPGALASERSGNTYTVKKGDSACAVAYKYGVPCDTLLSANELNRLARIYPGQTLRIPYRQNAATGSGKLNLLTKKSLKTTVIEYQVEKGDSACGIADYLGVSCKDLLTENRLGRRSVIYPGQKLRVSGVSEKTAKSLGPNRQDSVRSESTYTCLLYTSPSPRD